MGANSICRSCNEEKSIESFSQRSKDGAFRKDCKVCVAKRKAAEYDLRKQKIHGPGWKRITTFVDGGRRCQRCKEVKAFSEYRENPNKKAGIMTFCRPCETTRFTELQEKHKLNPVKFRQDKNACTAKYWKKNPDGYKLKCLVTAHRRRGRHLAAAGNFTQMHIEQKALLQDGRCYYCGSLLGENRHIDHKIPLVRGGTNWPANLCLACPTCNLRKNAKTPQEFRATL